MISIKTKKHKSLGVLSLVFIELFFIKSKTLTIEEIVQFFADNEKIEEKDLNFKSQTRRLYDIANVLKSLGVIEKVKHQHKTEMKNAFRWIGAKGFNLSDDGESDTEEKKLDVALAHPKLNTVGKRELLI